MGIVNVTPDSFSDGGLHHSAEQAINHAHTLITHGADIIDVGGESTRPGATPVSLQEERERVIPVIKGIREAHPHIPISVDTMKSAIAAEAVAAGATMVNDVSAGQSDPDMLRVVAELNVPYIIMHRKGNAQTMQQNPTYTDVVGEVLEFLRERALRAATAGIQNVYVDPGIGFGKTLQHNLEILKNLQEFEQLNLPIVLGISRKRMLKDLLGIEVTFDRDTATMLIHSLLLRANVHTIRVHNVEMAVQLRTLYNSLHSGQMEQ